MQRGQQIKCECAYQEAFKWVKNLVCMNHRRSTNFSSSAVHLANVVHLDVMLPLELWLSGSSYCFLHEKEKPHWCTASVELPAISRGNTNGNKRFETHLFDLWISAVRTGFLLIKGNFPPVVAIIKGSRAVGFSLKYCERAWPYYVKCPLKWHLLWFGIMQIRLQWAEWYGWKSGRKCEGRKQLDLAASSIMCIQACIWFCCSNVKQA